MHSSDAISNVLVYGGGINCKFYITVQYRNTTTMPVNIIGILDDTKYLKNQYIYGYKILGGIDDLSFIYKQHKFDKIILTTDNIEVDNIEKLKFFSQKYNIELSKSKFSEESVIL